MEAAMGLLEWGMTLVSRGWDVVIQRGHAQDWPHITANILHIVLAYALAFPIGWERGKNYNIAGLRTFPIVAMASCGYALAANDLPDFSSDAVSRVIQGLVAGIGFIGGGEPSSRKPAQSKALPPRRRSGTPEPSGSPWPTGTSTSPSRWQ